LPRLVFGLGNPGEEYEGTRHNVGFDVLDVLAKRWGARFERSRFVEGRVAAGAPAGWDEDARGKVRLVKPSTFMNLCGPAYARSLKVFETEAKDGLVVLDDFMLPFGRLRMRAQGSSGGHNGLKSIEGSVGSQAYPRLRIGIGGVPGHKDPADHVLSRYSALERKELPFVLEAAADAVVLWMTLGIEKAMDRVNREPEAE
jgi:PTH1 family peptidyl-tRNA hydrolase